jgi:hypothetical protein
MDVLCRFGGAVGAVESVGGGGVVGAHGDVAAVTVETGERFCAASAASTPRV